MKFTLTSAMIVKAFENESRRIRSKPAVGAIGTGEAYGCFCPIAMMLAPTNLVRYVGTNRVYLWDDGQIRLPAKCLRLIQEFDGTSLITKRRQEFLEDFKGFTFELDLGLEAK